jgi:polar amino acid transport system substrate-binding protein
MMAHIRITGVALAAWLVLVIAVAAVAQEMVILTEDVPPFNFVQDGEVTGLSAAVAKEIMRRLGVNQPIRVQPWARAYQTAQIQPNVLIFTVARTPEREGLFRWVGAVFINEYFFYRKKGAGVEAASLEEARKAPSIGVYRNDVRHQFLEANGFGNLDVANSDEENYLKLKAGRISLMISTPQRLSSLAGKTGVPADFLEPVGLLLKTELCLAFSRQTGDDVFLPFARAFEELRKEGFLERERAKWLE